MKPYLSLIKFSHTIFALPFALMGLFLGLEATGAPFSFRLLGLILACMVFARSAAMAFNRYLDRDIDARNTRTAQREIPAGIISPRSALIFVLINSGLFILSAWLINPLCFYLSPVALLVILGYSYTKRFTPLCHFVLGAGLGLAPLGAYLAAGGGFDLIPILYALAVLFWVSGFDIIYALQDEDFDREHSLYSMPSQLGRLRALRLSELMHLFSALLVFAAAWQLQLHYPVFGVLQWIAAGLFALLLLYQHHLVTPGDLSRVNMAFFTTNGVASLIFGGLMIADMLL